MLYKVDIAGMAMDPSSNTPIIILKAEEADQAVPIWIGLLEASAIASALKEIKFDRPMTHDLFKNFIEQMGARITKIEICDLRDNTYYAQVYFDREEGSFSMDARPSDAIALALRFQAPIYVDQQVVEKSAVVDSSVKMADDSQEGRKWADYLESLDEDDFGKYRM
ncbi:MAG: bifunctional nuclease family protein [Desulfobacterales bacterium]